MTRRSDIDAALQELYDQIPAIPDCTGQCWVSCGPIDMTARERQRIRAAGYKITPPDEARMLAETFWCEALTEDHRCAVYNIRPLMCRAWGAVEGMKCPYGCVPEGGWMRDEDFWQLLDEARQVAGTGILDAAGSETAASAAVQRHMDRVMAAGRGGIGLRAQHALPPGLRRPSREFPCPHCGFRLTVTPEAAKGGGVCGECGRGITAEEVNRGSDREMNH